MDVFALLHRTLHVLAAVSVDAGNRYLQALDLGAEVDADLRRVLVADHLRVQCQRLALVQDAGGHAVGALRDVQLHHLVVTWRGEDNRKRRLVLGV